MWKKGIYIYKLSHFVVSLHGRTASGKDFAEDMIGRYTLELYYEHTLWFSYTSPHSRNDSQMDFVLSRWISEVGVGPEDSKRGCSCFQIHPYIFAINAIKDQCFFQQFLLHKYSLCLFKGSIQNIAYAVLEAKEATHPYQSWQELFPGQFWNKFEYL